MTFLRVFIRRRRRQQFPGSSKRVLIRLQNGLLRAPTVNRPHVSLGICFQRLKPVKPPFSSVLVGAPSAP
jgi:hypothetical protein